MSFQDRQDGGRQLAGMLRRYRGQQAVVLGLPRGGVVCAYEVARALDAPLDVLLVRKLGAPYHPELAIGAIAEGGTLVLDERVAEMGISTAQIEELKRTEAAELARRMARFRGDRPALDVEGRTVILVDDGIATGNTALAAIRALRRSHPRRIVLATPVGAADAIDALGREVDEVVCLEVPAELYAIGLWYANFDQVGDEEVVALLERAQRERTPAPLPAAATRDASERAVLIDAAGAELAGDLGLVEGARAVVLFAHGSGSSRLSTRNRRVAAALRRAGLATLLIDLLTEDEEQVDTVTAEYRFDIDLLAERLVAVAGWLQRDPATRHLPICLFGASTGAAAALVAAARRPDAICAVVSRGGRPDLARPMLHRVRAPVLLIVGGADFPVMGLNREAMGDLSCERQLAVVAGATHLFEEPGALDEVARYAAGWFNGHLTPEMATHV